MATANLLAGALRDNRLTVEELHHVQARRAWPTGMTQRVQLLIQNRVIKPVLGSVVPLLPPFPIRLIGRFPFLQRFPARLIGLGFRPEHIRTLAL